MTARPRRGISSSQWRAKNAGHASCTPRPRASVAMITSRPRRLAAPRVACHCRRGRAAGDVGGGSAARARNDAGRRPCPTTSLGGKGYYLQQAKAGPQRPVEEQNLPLLALSRRRRRRRCRRRLHPQPLIRRSRGLACKLLWWVCPLCRCEAYRKQAIADAAELWRAAAATRIQAAWRGVLARTHARALRRLLPPTHPALRRRWAAERCGEAAAPLVACLDAGAAELDALFAELDAAAAGRASLYTDLERRCGGGSASAAAAAAAGASSPAAPPAEHGSSSGAGNVLGAAGTGAASPLDWEAVLDRCLRRDAQPECPICLTPLEQLRGASRPGGWHAQLGGSSGSGRAPDGRARASGGLTVLSCLHAFHGDCLSALEAFALASEAQPACPCCRAAPYQRLDLR